MLLHALFLNAPFLHAPLVLLQRMHSGGVGKNAIWCCCKGSICMHHLCPSGCITCVLLDASPVSLIEVDANCKLGTLGLVRGRLGLVRGDVGWSCAVLLVATCLRGLSGGARDGGAVPCSECQSRICIAALLRPTSTLTPASCDAPRGLSGAGRLGGNLPALPTQYLHIMRLHVCVREGERVRVSVYVCMCVCV